MDPHVPPTGLPRRMNAFATRVAAISLALALLCGAGATFPVGADIDSRSAGVPLVIGDDESAYTVSGSETHGLVTVLENATLTVKGTLVADGVSLEDGSLVVEGGTVTIDLSGLSTGADARILGWGYRLVFSKNAEVTLKGSNGAADKAHSQGGDALIDVDADAGIEVSNTTLVLQGGSGATNATAWTTANLGGWVAAGGHAGLILNAINDSFEDRSVRIVDSDISLNGGRAGDAANGQNSAGSTQALGGGYSNGGAVSGSVGEGGDVNLSAISKTVLMQDNDIGAIGGDGGDGGDGGKGYATGSSGAAGSGGGGGGYSGGNGGRSGSVAGTAATVTDNVGSGGDIRVAIQGFHTTVDDVVLTLTGGNAGHGGNGGDGSSIVAYYAGGGGGGGFGGGGGGTYPQGAGGAGTIDSRVAAGGEVWVDVVGGFDLTASGLTVTATGGRGGDGGIGGNGGGTSSNQAYAVGGGGGGGAGGGGAGYYTNGGKATLSQEALAGGNVSINVTASDSLNLHDSAITATGGSAGTGGAGGGSGNNWGGGGGGGIGGGGGTGYACGGQTPGIGTLKDHIGEGGRADIGIGSGGWLEIDTTLLKGRGGTGATIGQPGGANTANGAGGGAGYGGTGGHGGACGVQAHASVLSGDIGFGGDVAVEVSSASALVGTDLQIDATGGTKGVGAPSQPGGGNGGGGGDGYPTQDGTVVIATPRSVPPILGPEDGATLNYDQLTFSWQEVASAFVNGEEAFVSAYQLQVALSDTFDTTVLDVSDIPSTATSYSPAGLVGGILYWRIRAIYTDEGTSGWSAVRLLHHNTPPTQDNDFPALYVKEDTATPSLLDLDGYFFDDLFDANLTYHVTYQADATKLSLVVDDQGVLSAVPKDDFVGTLTFRVSATDPMGLTTEGTTFAIEVTAVNDPPRFLPISDVVVTEDTPYVITVGVYLFDIDDPPSKLQVTTDNPFATVSGLNVTLVYPNEAILTDVLNLTASDGRSQQWRDVNVTVTPVNDAPEAKKLLPITFAEDGSSEFDLSHSGRDEEDGSLSIQWSVSVPDSSLLTASIEGTHLLRIEGVDDRFGSQELTLTVTDSGGLEDSEPLQVTITPVNDGPRVAPIPDQTIDLDGNVQIDLAPKVTDVDDEREALSIYSADAFIFTIDGLTIRLGAPRASRETHHLVELEVSDGLSDTKVTINLTIRFPPTFTTPIPTITIVAGDKGESVDLSGFVTDYDQQKGVPLTFVVVARDLSGVSASAPVGVLQVSASANAGAQSGALDITATDSDGKTATTTVKVVVRVPAGGFGGGGGTSALLLGGIGLVAALAVAALVLMRRRRTPPAAAPMPQRPLTEAEQAYHALRQQEAQLARAMQQRQEQFRQGRPPGSR